MSTATPEAVVTDATVAAESPAITAETPAVEKDWRERKAEFEGAPKAGAPKVEAPKAEAPKADAEQDRFSARLAEMTKRESRLRATHEAHKSERAAFETERAEWRRQIEATRAALRSNPIQVLEQVFGTTYSDLTRYVMGKSEPTPQELVAQTEAKLRKEFEDRDSKAAQEREAQEARLRQEQQIGRFTAELGEELRAGDFPLISLEEEAKIAREAFSLLREEYARSKTVLAYSDVLAMIEKDRQTRHQAWSAALAAKGAKVSDGSSPKARSSPGTQASGPKSLASAHAAEAGPAKQAGWRDRLERFKSGQE